MWNCTPFECILLLVASDKIYCILDQLDSIWKELDIFFKIIIVQYTFEIL